MVLVDVRWAFTTEAAAKPGTDDRFR